LRIKPVRSGALVSQLYGLLAEFEKPEQIVRAAELARLAGYRRVEAYSPYPVPGLAEAVGHTHSRVPLWTLIGGVLGCVGAFGMQFYAMAIFYPLNVGGRPLASWPLFIPITFELTILGASLTAVLAMLVLNGLPMPHHPLFNVTAFEAVTRNRFFLCIQARDPEFAYDKVREFLTSVAPLSVSDVPLRRPPLVEEHDAQA
jgi:Protein of unknown function (DUF3341)